MDDRAESGLALHNGVWDTHLAAESWKEDNELNWVDIVWNEDEGSLLVLNETDNVVKTVLDSVWLLADILLLLTLLDGGSLLDETLLLLGLGLWAVLVKELEGLSSGVAVKNVLELSNGRWDLEAEVQDLLLALKTDILWPSHHARKVSLWLDGLTDTEVAGALLDEGVLVKKFSTYKLMMEVECKHTLACFLDPPAFPCGNGAAAAFFPVFGGYH